MSTVIKDEQAKENIAVNLRRLLEDRGYTQTALAEAVATSQSRISQLLRADRMASAGLLARIAEVFDVSIDRLVASPPEEISKISESRG